MLRCGHDSVQTGCPVCALYRAAKETAERRLIPVETAVASETTSPTLSEWQLLQPPCANRNPLIGPVPCSCPNRTIESYGCEVYDRCTVSSRYIPRDRSVKVCRFCNERSMTRVQKLDAIKKPPAWSYGVTTLPARFFTTLPRTLLSLKEAGFDRPRLFIDSVKSDIKDPGWESKYHVTRRTADRGHPLANWWLSLHELYARAPEADYHALFQDDFVMCRGTREYLESVPWPGPGYVNLSTYEDNQRLPRAKPGFFKSNGQGLGAVALVFNRESIRVILRAEHMVEKFVPKPKKEHRAVKAIDGGVVTAFKLIGQSEWVHMPALVQHTGRQSTIGNEDYQSPSFKGEEFDARSLLK